MLGGHSPAPVPTPPRSGNNRPFCEPRKPKFDCWKRSKSPKGSARYPDLPSMALDRGYTFEGTPLPVRCQVGLAGTYPVPPLPAAASGFPGSRSRTASPALGGPICWARTKRGLSSWEPTVHAPACSLPALEREQEEKLASAGAKTSPESRKWYKLSQHSLSKLNWGVRIGRGGVAYLELQFLQGIVSKIFHFMSPQPSKQGPAQNGWISVLLN